MYLSRSTGRKLAATALGAVSFAFFYEVTALDSRFAARQAERQEDTPLPDPGKRIRFTATAYCKGTTTASGVNVRTGIAAADPELLPVGSVIQVEKLDDRFNGIYTVMDTGPKVQGRQIDVYMWSCHEALKFGRRAAQVTVLRLGWNPRHTTPRLFDGVLPPPSAPDRPLPSRPIASPSPFPLPHKGDEQGEGEKTDGRGEAEN